ncbi:MAG: hypothetical protein DI604_23990 [Delftia acidovorans]|nr:MAG: hypothetical protein DI604_23990 [Delftia acidovorans]
MTEFTRRERIRTILIEEFKGDGHKLFEHEGETYARLVENTKRGAVVLAEFNLDTLASQIDRRLG